VLAAFDGPARALRTAQAIRSQASAPGLTLRAGLHSGECELRGADLAGIAVHIGARVAALAGPGEILATGTRPRPDPGGGPFAFRAGCVVPLSI
jgi:class 3 adenylate cyclase